MSKPITKEAMLNNFIEQAKSIAHYWAMQECDTRKDMCEGVVFSILTMIDGNSGGFPCSLDLVLSSHEDDKKFSIDNDEDYVVNGMVINDDCQLHEMFYSKKGEI